MSLLYQQRDQICPSDPKEIKYFSQYSYISYLKCLNIDSQMENNKRSKLIQEYKLIFGQYPELEKLAKSYWERTANIDQFDDLAAYEESVLSDIVIQMSDILLNSKIFIGAMKVNDTDPTENAIIECLTMIDIAPDL